MRDGDKRVVSGENEPRRLPAGIRKWILAGIAAIFSFFPPSVKAEPLTPAFVQEGAFLLSREATVLRGDRFCHDIVGYIPVGTVVYGRADSPPVELFNYDRGQYEHYRWVESDIGLAGLLRDDLKQEIGGDILVPVANRRIAIHTLNSTKFDARKLSEFSRSDGVFLTVLGDDDPDFLTVALPWTAEEDRPPDRGKLFKRFVEDGEVRRLSPETVQSEYPRVYERKPRRLPDGEADPEEDYLRKISEEIADRIDETAESVHLFLENLEQIRCIISSEADLDLGLKIFGSGLGLHFALNLKEKDRFWDVGRRVYYKGERRYKEFVTLKAIACRDSTPYRMEHFMLAESNLNPNKRALVWASDIDRGLAPVWGPSLQGASASRYMFPVTGYASYERAFTFLEAQSENGSGYLTELTPADRRILINIILSEIAYFTKPKVR